MSRLHDLNVRVARHVAGMSDENLDFVQRGIVRRIFLSALAMGLPRKFKRRVGGDIEGVLELRFVDPDGGEPDRIQLAMRKGRCRAKRDGVERPDATATMHLTDLVRLATGSVEAGWLAHDGRVVLTGDPFLFVRFPSAFGLRTRPLYADHRGPTLRP